MKRIIATTRILTSRNPSTRPLFSILNLISHIQNYNIDIDTNKQYRLDVNSKQRKILESIFSSSTPANIEWKKIESLFLALGATMIEGSGSRVSFILNNEKGDFHRPHPGKEAKRYQVKNAQEFLFKAGVLPQ